MPPVHHLHTDTIYDALTGGWSVCVSLNGSPIGKLGPVLEEETADILAEGIREGLQLAMTRAMSKVRR